MGITIIQKESDEDYEEKETTLENINKKDFIKKVIDSNK